MKVREKEQMTFIRPKRWEEVICQQRSHICFYLDLSIINVRLNGDWGVWGMFEVSTVSTYLISLILLFRTLTSSNAPRDNNSAETEPEYVFAGLFGGHSTEMVLTQNSQKIPNCKAVLHCSLRFSSRWCAGCQTLRTSWTSACVCHSFSHRDSAFMFA